MAGLTAEEIRAQAMERIADKPSMVLDGDPINEIALAHERHAARIDSIIDELETVGQTNHLGETVEGRAATHNIRVALRLHPGSVVETMKRQAAEARQIAERLRALDKTIERTEADNVEEIWSTSRWE